MHTLRTFWRLARPFWTSEQKYPALLLLLATVAMNLCLVGVNILNNFWNLHFYNALQEKDYPGFLLGGLQFILLQIGLAAFTVGAFHFQQKLTLLWRRWSTRNLLAQWLDSQRYQKLKLTETEVDNPDQRIAEDIDLFIIKSLKLSLGLLTAVVSLFSFLNILWQASGLVSIPWGDEGLVIPGLLVWVALLYALLGTGFAFWLGRALPHLNFVQQRREADFRFSLMRLRENADSVAQYRGEAVESQRFNQRLEAALQNFWVLVKKQKLIMGYSTFYLRSATVIPMFIMAPQFFAGAFPLGRLTQISAAFGEVHAAVAYLVGVFPELAEWKSVVDRLDGFQNRLDNVKVDSDVVLTQRSDGLHIRNLAIWLPDGRRLFEGFNLTLKPGDSLLIKAPSGYGKSTLIRAVTGLWHHASGSVAYDRDRALTLSQKTYLPLGSLRETLWYPLPAPEEQDAVLQQIMRQVGLEHLDTQLAQERDWAQTLSLGEQQRCAFVRALLARPAVLFLDESSAAMDAANEARCYQLLKDMLPDTILISVGHHASLERFHGQVLELQDEVEWVHRAVSRTV
ncbi:ABC transporter ATP-binding protein/permease [Pseudomonas fluorescens group sp.]|uniref:Membrane transport protein ATP-binding component n=2 Tax=Pseudomonas fluorescens TaxID=294 RepID=C3KC58_PSEFS|nr:MULTISPECIES: ABC transporter ATP-binding protein/permease [Pseudomonas fluorescens group]MBZ6454255.1 ABC transporter ATP-binding protein/permease [Pseudomonas fluorescens group sp.]MBZ6460241.1 ABC transporter ATP-binding protein/permease [Pseudomonas fluorescens group sp.]MBZ6465882.1 ABC transporter ATP-binding protein/permease [Pseudomonas fluorescens group sp.]WQD69601.1 ABC transporter ATP-binding protein/permease [Pseudomonas marginalis]CAI2797444.1 Putative membrane transport prote